MLKEQGGLPEGKATQTTPLRSHETKLRKRQSLLSTLWEQIPKWAEKGSNQFVYKLLVGVGNGSPALHRHLSYDPCNSNVRYSPRAMKAYVHTFTTNSSFICNSQKLETTQMSTDEWITKSAGCNTTQQQEKQIIDYSGCGHVDASYLILS